MFVKILLILSPFIGLSHTTPIFGVDSIFEVFTPISMVRFFEFSDEGWNITESCIKDMYLYLDGLQKDQPWAIKLFDSSGYYSGGLLSGSKLRLNDPDFCQELNNDVKNVYFNGNLIIFNQSSAPFLVRNINAKYRLNLHETILQSGQDENSFIVQTICMPKSCNLFDLKQIMSYNHNLFSRYNKIVRTGELIGVTIFKEEYNVFVEFNFFVLIGVTLVSLLIIILATLYDNFNKYPPNIDEDQTTLNNVSQIPSDASNISSESITNTNSLNSTPQSSLIIQSAIDQISKSSNLDSNSLTNLKMDPLTDSMTVNNINTNNHVNLVQIKKIKNDETSTISLDIITGNCDNNRKKIRAISKGFFKELTYEVCWRNIRMELLEGSEGENVEFLSGIKVICLLWVLLIRTYSIFYEVSDNKIYAETIANNHLLKFLFTNNSFSIDMFFFICGISISFMFYKTTETIDKIDKFCGILEQILYFLVLILNKFLRIILTYTVTLILVQIFMKYFNDFSVLEIPSIDHETCEENMWRNVLYIDTFYPITERCMPWSNFISLEVQFFILAAILMLLSRNHPKYTITLSTSFFVCSLITMTVMKMVPDVKERENFSTKLSTFNGVSDQPLIRIGPYLIGMCFGYILYRKQRKMSISKILSFFIWITCILLTIIIIFGDKLIVETRPWIKACFLATTSVMWLLILIWIILSKLTGNGGPIGYILNIRIFHPMSKLTNSVYLIHPLITRIIILSSNGTIHLSFGTIITMYFGLTLIAYFVGLILYILFEAPISAFLKVLHQKTFQLQ